MKSSPIKSDRHTVCSTVIRSVGAHPIFAETIWSLNLGHSKVPSADRVSQPLLGRLHEVSIFRSDSLIERTKKDRRNVGLSSVSVRCPRLRLYWLQPGADFHRQHSTERGTYTALVHCLVLRWAKYRYRITKRSTFLSIYN